jgi:hypothetical protein
VRSVHHDIRRLEERLRCLQRADRNLHPDNSRGSQTVDRSEGLEVGHIVAGIEEVAEVGLLTQPANDVALGGPIRGREFQDPLALQQSEPVGVGDFPESFAQYPRRGLRVRRAPVMNGELYPLVFDPRARNIRCGPLHLGEESLNGSRHLSGDRSLAVLESVQPVVADLRSEKLRHVAGPPTRDHGHHPKRCGEQVQGDGSVPSRASLFRRERDVGEGSVEVEEDARLPAMGSEGPQPVPRHGRKPTWYTRRRLSRCLASLLLFVITACAPHQVTLSYTGKDRGLLSYHLALNAEIDRTLSGETRHELVEAIFEIHQEVLGRLPDGRTRVRLTLRPKSLMVNGTTRRVGEAQEFVITNRADGSVVGIDEARGEATEALAPVGIERLLPRLQPVLPGRPVGPGDSWRSESAFEDASGRFSLALRSRLAALGRSRGHLSALLRTTYASPVKRREIFANAVADIEGRDVGTQEAWFALEGFLVRAAGDSVGRYRVLFRPPGGEVGVAPVEGQLHVRLHTDMRLVPQAAS